MKAFGNDNEQIATEAGNVDVLRNTFILILNSKFRFLRQDLKDLSDLTV